jgi:hypothetical protein
MVISHDFFIVLSVYYASGHSQNNTKFSKKQTAKAVAPLVHLQCCASDKAVVDVRSDDSESRITYEA